MRSFDVPPKHSAPLTRGLFLRRSTSCVESRCLLSDLDRSGERLVPVRLIVKALLPQESCPFPVLVRHHQEHRPFLHSKADSCDSHHSASATPALIMCSSHGPQNCGKLTTHPFDGSKPNSAPPRRGFSSPSLNFLRRENKDSAKMAVERRRFSRINGHVVDAALIRGLTMHIDQHLDLVTTIFARPEMTDFVLAHVLRPLRRNHQLITFSARHSVGRATNDPSGRHRPPPLLFVSLWRGELKAL